MAYDRRTFAGGAVATTLTSGIDSSTLSIPIAASTGWPTGSAGDFYIVIDRGTASEEKVRVDTRTSLTLTAIAGGRGVDGTTGVAHSSGAAVEVCLTAVDLDEANAHIADTALDHHTQYLNTTRHDVEARHTFGAALGTPAAAADIGTTAAAGTGDNPAREDHVHQIGTGAIDTAAMFAAGVVDKAAIEDAQKLPSGMISMTGAAAAPTGWLLCNGAAVSRTTYADLFTAIGTAYGVGDGSTTFNVPNLKAKFPIGLDATDTDVDALGETGGAKTVTLSSAEMPAHTHTIGAASSNDEAAGSGLYTGVGRTFEDRPIVSTSGTPDATSSTGGGGAHNNMPPFLVVNFIVKT